MAGASLLALFLAGEIVLGPWAATWFLAALWLVCAGVFSYFGLHLHHVELGVGRLALWAVALGFAGLAAATALRALGGTNSTLWWLCYGLSALGIVGSVALIGSAGLRRSRTP